MKQLQPDENDLVGNWLVKDKKVEGDETCERIRWLIKNVLKEVTTDASGWDTLYSDPHDMRYWELTYPQSHMHGGGPPRLACLSTQQVKEKYGSAALTCHSGLSCGL